jgi:hypothetical protein
MDMLGILPAYVGFTVILEAPFSCKHFMATIATQFRLYFISFSRMALTRLVGVVLGIWRQIRGSLCCSRLSQYSYRTYAKLTKMDLAIKDVAR